MGGLCLREGGRQHGKRERADDGMPQGSAHDRTPAIGKGRWACQCVTFSAPCIQRTRVPEKSQSTTENTNKVAAMPPKIVSSPSCSANEPMMPASQLATKLIRNQTPIISEASRSGASLVTIDSPTGEMQSSPVVWKKEGITSEI